jgi:hypothetical protein
MYTVTVAWGDGTSDTILGPNTGGTVSISEPGGFGAAFQINADHTYTTDRRRTPSP